MDAKGSDDLLEDPDFTVAALNDRVTQLENNPVSSGIEYYFDGTDLEITAVVNNGVYSLSGTTLNITVS